MSYKYEVFFIKGRYYKWIGVCYNPLASYGAVSGSLSIDASDSVAKYDGFSSDVLIGCHDGKWGLLSSISIITEGSAEFASEDGTPFIYDNYDVVRSGEWGDDPDSYEVFILLQKDSKWKALRLTRGKDTPVSLPEEPNLEVDSKETLIKQLEERYGIKLHVQAREDYSIDEENELREFDDQKDFMRRYVLDNDYIRLIQLAIGVESYSFDTSFIYAAAHHNLYATILIGKEILDNTRNKLKKKKELDSYETTLLKTSIEYLRLGKEYADKAENKTMSDIAAALLDDAETILFLRTPRPKATKPLVTLRSLKDRKKKV